MFRLILPSFSGVVCAAIGAIFVAPYFGGSPMSCGIAGYLIGNLAARTSMGTGPWWKDKTKGWPGHGVRDFFRESEALAEQGQIAAAIEVLEWGVRFSQEFGSGGGAHQMQEMITTLRQHL